MPRTPQQMEAAVIANLPARTGRTADEWVAFTRAHGPTAHRERVAWLKGEHGLGHVAAWLIAEYAGRSDDYVEPSPDALVAAQYAGAKAGLRPIYARLLTAVRALGEDVQIEPRKTYVAFSCGTQFALAQPTTRDRVDLGLRLRHVEPAGRLQTAGSFGSGSITHRIALTSADEVDDELVRWLQLAYTRTQAAGSSSS